MPEPMIGRTIEHFRIDHMLGQGGMAAVFKATDLKLQRQVALKIMHPHLASQKSFQQRFLKEARAAANLDHPNIVRVLEFKIAADDLYLVMELITGGSLRQYIKRLHEDSRFIDYPEAIEVTRQLAEALDYAHRQNMIHRDIKPDNVLLKPDPEGARLNYRPILTDFGLAKLTDADEDAITDQQPIGTYPYMSPEQCLGEQVDARTDIYSLGIMLYELSVGRLPYNPKTIAEAARMHGRDPLTLPSALRAGFPGNLEEVIIRSLRKDPADRYRTAAEMARALQEMQGRMAPPVRPEPAPVVIQRVGTAAPGEAEYSTDLSTAVMARPLPEAIPDLPPPKMPDDIAEYDRLIFFSADNPTFAARVDRDVISIGRDPDQDIVLEGGRASRRHLRLERKPNGKYTITDLKSTNGVWLDDQRLTADVPVILNPGSVVRLGDYWMRLELKPAVEEEAPSVAVEGEQIAPPAVEAQPGPAPVQVQLPPSPPPAQTEAPVVEAATGEAAIATQPMAAGAPKEPPRHTPPHYTAEQVGFDRLVFYSESDPTITYKLDKDHVSIGRAEDQDVALSDRCVSRRHARLDRVADGRFTIIDLGSSNGTWIDGRRLKANTPVALEPEKLVHIGYYWMQYEPKRDIPEELKPSPVAFGATAEFELDPNATVSMVKPLSEEMPAYSPPPLTIEMRTSDRLIFFSEDHPLQVVKLDKEITTIGRDENQDVTLQGRRVSRQHARIEVRPDGNLYVTDLESTNGVWVGDTLLVPNTQVVWSPDEIVRIGNYWLKFERGMTAFEPFAAVGAQDTRGLVGKMIRSYRIDRFLGQGSLAAVYKATELPLERPVALKIMHPNLAAQDILKQRYLQEARMLSRLDHPNIVRVLSYDSADNELFMVMELITGISLRAHLNKLRSENKSVDVGDAVSLIIQMADGLHYAHQQGMIHRDMRPESIVLKPTTVIGPIVKYQPVMTDFAVARLSESGEIFVTEKPDADFPYMSPEQCLGERVDTRSDIYELGVVFYEMLVGRPPYQPRSLAEAIRMHAREPLQRPSDFRSDIPDDLEKIVLRALEKDPNNRYQSADEFSRALQRSTIALTIEGLRTAGLSSMIAEEQVTAIMEQPLPTEMPMPTRAPMPDESMEHDRLVLYSENHPTKVILLDKNVLTIGRDNEQDIVLLGDKVSRRHARLERGLGGVYRLIDLGSRNGSWLGNYRLISNVAEIWDRTQTVRVGDYWLRIETPEDFDLRARSGRRRDEEFETDGGAPQAAVRVPPPPPIEERIGVTVNNPAVRVVPGSTVTLPVEVVNRSEIVDHFRVEVVGLPSDWVSQPMEPLYLLPHNRDTTSVTFHPPLASSSSAGGHAYEVRVTARAQGLTAPGVQGTVNIEPLHNFVTDLQPKRIKGRGRAQLTINNTGNTFDTYTLQARDRENGIDFDFEGKQYTLPPGHTEFVNFRATPKKRPFIGAQQTYPFEISVAPAEETAPPQMESGEVVASARFPLWTIGGCLLMLVLCGLLAAFAYTQLLQFNGQNQTATAVALATGGAATATMDANADPDGDGLSNAREIELGTFPDLADTDEDGLNDGEEIRVWLTNPLNRDTDGDTLTDGEEVRMGTDPLKRDTDDDGIPDNEDVSPSLRSTATLTPFPTIPGTVGDICPGSPSPSRIQVGMRAFVTPGGVANRVRDMPGKQVGEIIGYMPPETEFIVIGGPECDPDDQLRWWQVNYSGLIGWTAEGEGDEYYLGPPEEEDSALTDPPRITSELRGGAMGVQVDWNVDTGGWNTVLTMARPLDVGWVKLQVSWSAMQPESGGVLGGEFSKFQASLQDAKNQGYKVLVTISKAPGWARLTDRSEDGPPDDPEDLARFIGLLLDQVGENVDAIEIWNEPNLQREWTGSLPFSGKGYMQLFEPAYERIRDYSDSIRVVTAGLAPTTNTLVSVDDRTYLRQMYDAGLADFEDVAVGIHPYGWGNPPEERCCDPIDGRSWDDQPQFFFLDNIADYRAIMLAYDHDKAKLWATEFGWTSWEDFTTDPPEPWMAYITPDDQSTYAMRAFQIGQALNFMGPMFLWNFNYANAATVANRTEVAGYSLVFMDAGSTVRARPVYDALVIYRQQLNGTSTQ